MNDYYGDFTVGSVIRIKFNTLSQALVPTAPSVGLAFAVYKNSVTEITNGISLSSNYDSLAGFHMLSIDTSADPAYVAGEDYDIVFTAGTVDGIDLTRVKLKSFSLENRNTKANVTQIAGQNANAAAPVAFPASVANETTVASRASQASVDTLASYVDTEVAAIKAKTDNLPTDPADASDIAASFATVNATLATIAGYIDTEVAAIKAKTDNLPIDPADASDIAASFASLTSLVNILTTYVDTEVAAIKAKTDNLPVDPADASDIAASFANVNSALSTIASYIDTEVAAIKAKTDNLPAQPAAVGDIPTAAAIADAVLEENVDDHDGVAHSLAKYISIIKKANTVVDGVVSSAASPTTLTFTSNVNYPTGAFNHSILMFLTGNLAEQNSPIISYSNTNGAIVVEEAFTQAPAVGDEFIIIPTTHVHSISEIVSAVWSFTLAGIDAAGSAAKVLSDAGTGVATLVARITSAVYNTLVDLAQMIVNDGTVNAQWSSTAMANIPVAGGTGARTVTITVRDPSASPIQNATVRISRTGESFALQTNASGVATFSLDDATWTVAITATGFSFSPVSLVVAANVSQTYSMTAAGGGVTPSETPLTTGFWTVYGVNGTIQAGAQVSIQASSPPTGSTGIVMEDAVRTATADNNGVVQFNNLVKGATYIVYRTGSSRKFNIVVPANAGNTVALGSIVG